MASNFKTRINPFTGQLQKTFDPDVLIVKGRVDTTNDLPTSGNSEGDVYIVTDAGSGTGDTMYVWTLSSASGTVNDWKDIGDAGSVAWGSIGGTLADQTDLQNTLDGKSDTGHSHTASDVSDFDTEVSNNSDVSSNTSHRGTTTGNPHSLEASDVPTSNSGETVQSALNGKADTGHSHTASDVTDFDTEVSNNTDVSSNTSARHTQNTDTKLDEGGANELTASETRTHLDSTSNPHSVTKSQVGLGNVQNVDTTPSGLQFMIDGGGGVISTGIAGWIEVPYSCDIQEVRLLADQSGSIQVDIWKDNFANYPPTDADSITASAVPSISGANKSEDTTLTGWTTTVSAGDILYFSVDSVTNIEKCLVSLTVTKT